MSDSRDLVRMQRDLLEMEVGDVLIISEFLIQDMGRDFSDWLSRFLNTLPYDLTHTPDEMKSEMRVRRDA